MREYSFYLRIAFATTMKCPIDYYSAPDDMWTPPEPGSPYSSEGIVKMIVKGTGLEFPYPDATAPGREEIPPAQPESVEQRQTIGAIQEAQTMESLQQVGVGLPNPQDVEIPSGESQSAEAAQARPELPTRAGFIMHGSAMLTRPQQAEMTPVLKERVDFNKDDEVEPSMWKSALMTATRNWLSAPVGSGLTEGAPSSPEELEK